MLGALASLITNPKVVSGIGEFVSSALDKVSPTIGNVVRTLTGSSPQVASLPAPPVLPATNNANSMSSVVVPNSYLNRTLMPNTNIAHYNPELYEDRHPRDYEDDRGRREPPRRDRNKSRPRNSRYGKYRRGIYN